MYKLAFLIALTQFVPVVSPLALAADTADHQESGATPYIPSLNLVTQPGDARQLLEQGLKLYQTEQFSQAEFVLQQAVAAFITQSDVLNQALALNYVALAAKQVGKLPQASKAIAQSLTLLQKNNSQEFLSVRARALNTQGQIQLAQGHADKAVASWIEATTLYTKTQDNAGVIGSKINQAQAMQALGLYRRAIITLVQVNQQLQQQPDSPIKATGLLSLGNALRVVGMLDNTKAKPSIPFYSQQTLQRLREVEKKKPNQGFEKVDSLQALEESLKVASKLNSPELVAQIQLSLGNTAQALRSTSTRKEEYTTEALQHYEDAAASGSPITRLQAQLNQLRLLVQIERWTDVQILLPQIQSQLATLPPTHKTIYARINVTQTLACLKQRTEAMAKNPNCPQQDTEDKDTTNTKSLQPLLSDQTAATLGWAEIANIGATAVEEAKSLGDQRAEAYALGTLGGLYEQTHDLPSAEKLTQQALALAESIQAPDIGYRWQWQLGRILKSRGNEPGAIAAYTKAVDNLKTLRNDLVNINPDVQYSFREGVEPVYRELVSLLLQSRDPRIDKNSVATARNVIESLRLAELDNFFRRACINAKTVNIDKVDRTAAVIYPVVLSDRLEVIVSLPSSSNGKPDQILLHHSMPVSQQEVKDTTIDMRQKLETRSTYDFLQPSQTVYNWIIRPIESELTKHKVKNLVFVLDNPLGNIPMEALHDGKQYLIQKYNVSLTPGLQLLNPQPIARTQLRIIAGGLSEGSNNFPPLPNVKNELDAIKSELSNTRVLLNQQFTKEAIENTVKSLSAPVVHLATHGTFSSKAEGTYIVTYDGNVNVNELNDLLTTRETNQRGAIELLVLSACSTATGDQRAALGIAGVAVRSGARSTLASLWTVDDKATSLIMTEFYKQLNEPNISKTEAFKRAQLSMLKNPLYDHPYYWAPYVLVGNWL